MKTANAATDAALYDVDVQDFRDLFTFYLGAGTQRWTSAGGDVTYSATTWTAAAIVLSPIETQSKLGLEVDDVDLSLASESLAIGGIPLRQAAVRRLFNGIRLVVERAVVDAAGTVTGTLPVFDGTISDVEPGSTEVRISAVSHVAKFRRQVPPRVFQVQCPLELYGARCGASRAAFTHARTVAAGSTATVINLSSSSTFAITGSRIRVPSTGEVLTVGGGNGVSATLAAPLAMALSVGTAIEVIRGCDRTLSTCRDVFANVLRFGGFYRVPKE